MESHFIGEAITVEYDRPPLYRKRPHHPARFLWQDTLFVVEELLETWQDYRRRGRMGNNMRPENLARAAQRGSWGVGRFFFKVRVSGGRVFELYYDRAPQNADDRYGGWYLKCEYTAEDDK